VQAAGAGELAGVGLLGPRDQPQERRLAVAVAADDADPVALGDAQRDPAQDGPAAVALVDVLEVDEVARRQGALPQLAEPATEEAEAHAGKVAPRSGR
jgi:hypothetical protein